MAIDLREECDSLSQLKHRRKDPRARQRLLDALSSKWDGVQVTAAEVLLEWGDKQSVQAVRELLPKVASQPVRWSTTNALARQLAHHLQAEEDLDWAVEVFLNAHADNRFVLTSLFEPFPARAVLSRLEQELPGSGGGKRAREVQAAIARAQTRVATEKANSALQGTRKKPRAPERKR